MYAVRAMSCMHIASVGSVWIAQMSIAAKGGLDVVLETLDVHRNSIEGSSSALLALAGLVDTSAKNQVQGY